MREELMKNYYMTLIWNENMKKKIENHTSGIEPLGTSDYHRFNYVR